eukprot:GEMP01134515.1.p1 GENE.GEMP01134515.1~~GEMP01134515.1.p1  ORF type:complete len:123 (+),score=3.16 GEMP01134515.1:83-451(+)
MPPESRVRALADHVICPYSCAGDANAPRSTQKVESRDVTAPTVHYGRARSEAKDDIPKFSWFDSPYRKVMKLYRRAHPFPGQRCSFQMSVRHKGIQLYIHVCAYVWLGCRGKRTHENDVAAA